MIIQFFNCSKNLNFILVRELKFSKNIKSFSIISVVSIILLVLIGIIILIKYFIRTHQQQQQQHIINSSVKVDIQIVLQLYAQILFCV